MQIYKKKERTNDITIQIKNERQKERQRERHNEINHEPKERTHTSTKKDITK